jgi:hypothetical protein
MIDPSLLKAHEAISQYKKDATAILEELVGEEGEGALDRREKLIGRISGCTNIIKMIESVGSPPYRNVLTWVRLQSDDLTRISTSNIPLDNFKDGLLAAYELAISKLT